MPKHCCRYEEEEGRNSLLWCMKKRPEGKHLCGKEEVGAYSHKEKAEPRRNPQAALKFCERGPGAYSYEGGGLNFHLKFVTGL
jgi:hypothetical protein